MHRFIENVAGLYVGKAHGRLGLRLPGRAPEKHHYLVSRADVVRRESIFPRAVCYAVFHRPLHGVEVKRAGLNIVKFRRSFRAFRAADRAHASEELVPCCRNGLADLCHVSAAHADKIARVAAFGACRRFDARRLRIVTESEYDAALFEHLAADGADLVAGVAACQAACGFGVLQLRFVPDSADIVLCVALAAGAGVGREALGQAGRLCDDGDKIVLVLGVLVRVEYAAADAYAALVAVPERRRVAVLALIAAGAQMHGAAALGACRRDNGVGVFVLVICAGKALFGLVECVVAGFFSDLAPVCVAAEIVYLFQRRAAVEGALVYVADAFRYGYALKR